MKILTLILAGGTGGRLKPLTERRAKPALPFAGTYKLIDFPLSNCVNSGLSDVWVIEQYRPHGLNEHLCNGRPWDLDRNRGGLQVMPPYEGGDKDGFAQGNADALFRQLEPMREFAPDLCLVMSADHIYRADFRKLIEQHLVQKADLTMAVTRVEKEASRFAVIEHDAQNRVTGFQYKPERPKTEVVSAEIFLYDAGLLFDTLEKLDNLEDYGHELLPYFVEKHKSMAWPLEGYWRDVGTIESYFEAHQDLLGTDPKLDLNFQEWPIHTRALHWPPARIAPGATSLDSLLSPGCVVEGSIQRTVLGYGVHVPKNTELEDVIVLEGASLRPGERVKRAIIDRGDTRVVLS